MTNLNNSDISKIKYFTLNDAISSPATGKTIFIIANERLTKAGHIGRYYTVFPSFKHFMINRHKYKHCHELLVDHKNNIPNHTGRLVFDFDIKDIEIPKEFKNQIEDTIIEVVERYFNNIDANKFEYIWSTSENPNKFSKHLTIKHLYFDNWMTLSKIFYQLFCIVWDEKYSWIESKKNLIDFQIVRNRASLRMVGSSKINGFPLNLDNEAHKFVDSLIRVYSERHRETEQLVTKDNINPLVHTNVLNELDDYILNATTTQHIVSIPRKIESPAYPKNVYQKAFKLYQQIDPDIFKMGKINGKVMSLLRIKPNNCLLSGKLHEQENAFIVIDKNDAMYIVKFGCYRFCCKTRSIIIGCMTIDNFITSIHPRIEQLKEKAKKMKKRKPLFHLDFNE